MPKKPLYLNENGDLEEFSSLKFIESTLETTDNNYQTICTYQTFSNSVALLRSRIVGIRSGGSAGNVNDTAAYFRTVKIKNNAGVVNILDWSTDFSSEDDSNYGVRFTNSGTDVLIQVKGNTNVNVKWKSLTEIVDINL